MSFFEKKKKQKKPLETILCLKYLMSFNLLLVDWKPSTLFEIKLILLAINFNTAYCWWYNWEIEVNILLQSKFANCKHKKIIILRDKKWTNWVFIKIILKGSMLLKSIKKSK